MRFNPYYSIIFNLFAFLSGCNTNPRFVKIVIGKITEVYYRILSGILIYVADKYGKYFFSGHGVHIFSEKPVNTKKLDFVFKYPRMALRLYKLYDRPSLLSKDYYELTGIRNF